jgi:cytoskeleton protein RodZ
MTPLHVELREGRERRGLTLDALHAATRISRDFLDAIERGDFDFLPRTYVRLFLRRYATQVGMDPQYVLDRYEELKGPKPEEVQVAMEPPRPVSWGVVVALAVGFGLLGWAGVTMFRNRVGDRYPAPPPEAASVQEAPVQATPESLGPAIAGRVQAAGPDSVSVPATVPVPAPAAEARPDTAAARPVFGAVWPEGDSAAVLRGVCVEQTWLDVSADGGRVFRGEMKPGEERIWTARERFFVVAGRSSGIQFSIQGRPLPRSKAWASEVLRMSITRSGVAVEPRRRPAEGEARRDTASADSSGRE